MSTFAPYPGYFTQLHFVGIFDRTFEVLIRKDRNRVFFKISTLVVALLLLIMCPLMAILLPLLDGMFDVDAPDSKGGLSQQQLHALLSVVGIQSVLSPIITIAGTGGMIRAVAEIYLGMTPEWLACLKAGIHRFVPLLCSGYVVMGLIVSMSLIPALILGAAFATDSGLLFFLTILASVGIMICYFYIMVCSALIFPSVMIEMKSATGGVRRAFELAQGRWCSIFCPFFVYGLVMVFVSNILRALFLGPDTSALFSTKGIVVTTTPSIVFMPFSAVLATAIYINLRVDKEGMNASVLAREILPESLDVSYTQVPEDGNKNDHVPLNTIEDIA
jgi:hypothetical protein